MSRRLFFTYNRPANVDNHYVVGSGVGSKSRFVRSALRRRSSNNAQGKPCCFPVENKKMQKNIENIEKPIYCERENEIYNECGSACTATCDDPNPICTEQCVKRCECRKGHVLHQNKCIPKHHCQNNYQCDHSFSSYKINDTSMCCWTDDIGPDGSGCKNKNSVCYLGASGGLLQVCPNSNIIDCSDVKYKCDSQKGSCVPDLTGTEASYNTCASQCSVSPPSGLPDVKKVIYFNSGDVSFAKNGDLDIAIEKGYNILIIGFLLTNPKYQLNQCTYPDCSSKSKAHSSSKVQCPEAPQVCWTEVSGTSLYTSSNFATQWWQKILWNDYNPITKSNDSGGGLQTKEYQRAISDRIKQKGGFIFFSAGGGSEKPWTVTAYSQNGKKYGTDVAKFVTDNQLHGIDFDIENIDNSQQKWLIDATTGAYEHFKTTSQRYYISHAPQPPYFSNNVNPSYPNYTEIYQDCSNMIDFLNVQFYNQGKFSKYMDEGSLLNNTSPTNPSYKSLHTISNIPYEKIVIGKPACEDDLGNGNFGLVSDTSLNIWYTKFNDANNVIPSTMIWQYHNNSIYDINAVYNNLT